MPKSFEEIMLLIHSAEPSRRALGMKYIGKQRYYEAIHVCVLSLKDEEDEVRASAAWALDEFGSPDTIPELINALYDSNFGVRSNAGSALIHMARRTIPSLVIPEVVDVLRDDSNPAARHMAYLVLHHIGGAEAQEAIKHYWKT